MTLQTAALTRQAPPDNIIEFNFRPEEPAPATRRSTSLFTSDGRPKPTAADPIRSLADIKAMQNYYQSHGQIRNYTIFTLGILFGLRAGDILALRWHHIYNPDYTFKPHCDVIESKTRKSNNPAITADIQTIITAYRDSLPADINYHDPVFISNKRDEAGNYRPITLSALNRILKAAAKDIGLTAHISSHSLRKTFAYQLLKQNPGSDEAKFALQRMLNHNDFKTTLTYCGLAQDAIDSYRSALGEVIL